MSLVVHDGRKLDVARTALVLDLLQLQNRLRRVGVWFVLVTQDALVVDARVTRWVHHVTLLTDIADVDHRLVCAGEVSGTDSTLEVTQHHTVLGVAGDGTTCLLQLALYVTDRLLRDLHQGEGRAKGHRVTHEHGLRT